MTDCVDLGMESTACLRLASAEESRDIAMLLSKDTELAEAASNMAALAKENPFFEEEIFKEVSTALEDTSAPSCNTEFLSVDCQVDVTGLSPCKSHSNLHPIPDGIVTTSELKDEYAQACAEVNSMKIVVAEYEAAMKKMITELRQLRANRTNEELSSMNKQLAKELSILKQSHADLKSRYEDLKTISDGIRKTEELQRQTIAALEGDISRSEQKYESLRVLAEQKIAEANAELARFKQEAENENSALRAKITRAELTIKSLESTIEAKTNENKELMSICDDLISKMDVKSNY